jgi:acyl-ACP thioesterase
MERKTIWDEEFKVRSHETDFREQWKPSSFFQVMQEATMNHANHLGFGYHDMLKRNLVWIMTRVKINFTRFPARGERVIVRTWPRGLQQKLFFMRDYQFDDAEGRTLAVATSAWVLVNPEVRRILPPEALTLPFPDNGGKTVLDDALDKIPVPAIMEEKFRAEAGYTSLDVVGHVNNIRYIDWACDCFPLENYSNRALTSLQINFSKEIKPGEQVALLLGKDSQPGLWVVHGNNLISGVKAFDAALQWSEPARN